jgi:hypothetical protein
MIMLDHWQYLRKLEEQQRDLDQGSDVGASLRVWSIRLWNVRAVLALSFLDTQTAHDARLRSMQESIKASSAWFHACALHASGMAMMMLQRAQQLPDFQSQLHIIFLLNDIFFSGCATLVHRLR